MAKTPREVIADAISDVCDRLHHHQADAIVVALDAVGFVIVPKEPTGGMIDAASDFHCNGVWTAADSSIFGGIYRAMIAAASTTPTSSGEKG